jgi:hypothetical protein
MRRHAMSAYAEDICATYADALPYRLATHPEESVLLNRRLNALQALVELTRGIEDYEPAKIRHAAIDFEQALVEDTEYLGRLCTLLYWLLDARLRDPDIASRLQSIDLLTRAWPSQDASQTWDRIAPPMLSNVSLWQSIRHASTNLLAPDRWNLPWAVMRDRMVRAWSA